MSMSNRPRKQPHGPCSDTKIDSDYSSYWCQGSVLNCGLNLNHPELNAKFGPSPKFTKIFEPNPWSRSRSKKLWFSLNCCNTKNFTKNKTQDRPM